VGSAIRYSAEYNMTDSPTMDLIVPAETIIDLFGTYRTTFMKTPTEITLNLINLTDEINDLTRGDGFEARISVGFRL
jgi:outer membrane receptor protein involved in Fe transport